jgi:hypothetical protein
MELRKIMPNPVRQFPDQDSISDPPKYEAGEVILQV